MWSTDTCSSEMTNTGQGVRVRYWRAGWQGVVGGRRGVVVGRGRPCLWARQPGAWGWDPEVNRPKMACGKTGRERGHVRVWQVMSTGLGVGEWGSGKEWIRRWAGKSEAREG